MGGNLVLILGDQLSEDISSLNDFDSHQDTILMCEVWDETKYVKHHKKKIAFLFSAMRHFAENLKQKKYKIRYTKLDDKENAKSFRGEVRRAVQDLKPSKIIVTFPGEYRVYQDMISWEQDFGVAVEIRNDDRFLSTPEDFRTWATGRKSLRMEFFYRDMRKKYNILMDGDKPEGGEWNYDSENRKSFKKSDDLFLPKPLWFSPDDITKDVLSLVEKSFDDHFGDLDPFYFAVTRAQALEVLDKFITERFPNFGDYQDAMLEGNPWLYHSHISFYLNAGLLNPMECIRAAEKAYRDGRVRLNAAEGFIRQILGWREYIRGIYWLKMPEYSEENFLDAKRKLPAFYWTGKTDMNCLKQCVGDTKKYAYAHHIQRLMVLGNFALLAGIDPKEVNKWYLIVYADAYEWVELPNVSGMILYADGGYLASKPYAAGGAYINKMSNYCKNCKYDVAQKNGPHACPFNYLYWNFLMEAEDKLSNNPRLGISYKNLKSMDEAKKKTIQDDSAEFFKTIYAQTSTY